MAKTPSAVRWMHAAALAVMFPSLLGLLSAWHQLFDLCSHFRAQYFTLLAVLAIWLWRWKSPRFAAAVLLACLHNGALIAPYYLPAKSAAGASPTLSLISFNVHLDNSRYGDVLAYLQQKKPDVILLIEVNDRWIRELSALHDDHPHRVLAPSDGPFGIAMYSRFPIRRHELLGRDISVFPSIWAELDVAGRRVGFLGTHPPPPILPRMYQVRNRQLALVAQTAASSGMPTIVAGDFNATPWCSGFQQLLAAGLVDTASGRGLQPTWNAHLPLMWIPIDHVLTTKELVTLRRQVGPNCGSDHYAVEAELGLSPSERGASAP